MPSRYSWEAHGPSFAWLLNSLRTRDGLKSSDKHWNTAHAHACGGLSPVILDKNGSKKWRLNFYCQRWLVKMVVIFQPASRSCLNVCGGLVPNSTPDQEAVMTVFFYFL